MLHPVAPADRARLWPLFADYPGLDGCIEAVLVGGMGTALADNAAAPRFAHLYMKPDDFRFFGGDHTSAAAEAETRALGRAYVVVPYAAWIETLRRAHGDSVGPHTRTAFRPGRWDRADLEARAGALPPGFTMKRIDSSDIARYVELEDSFAYNFASHEDFLAKGIGFGIEHDGRFVSGCSSFAIGPTKLEFEIQTHPDYRRRNLAFAVASRMIAHCIEAGLEPCWDAANPPSAALATKLGFVDPRPYEAYWIAREPSS
jgi:GNAT superfamily N-acetyltransferase